MRNGAPQDIEAHEVPVCNSPVVKDLALKSFDDMKQAIIEAFPPSTYQMNRWQMDLVNIRQSKYDDVDDIRYCTADFAFQNSPPDIMMLAWLTPGIANSFDAFSQKTASYQIHRNIGRPGQYYISWRR